MQKKYIGIFAVIMILLVVGSVCSLYLDYTPIPQRMSDRTFKVVENKETDTALDNQFLWFTYEGDDIVLHYLPIASNFSTVRYLDPEGNYYEAPIEGFEMTDEMGGTFIVTTDEPVSLDINNDGVAEQVRFCAKTDTNSAKGFYGNPRYFGQESIPLEIAVDRTYADVLVYGQPYSGDLQAQSSWKINEIMDIEDGAINFIDYREFRKGLFMFSCDTGGETLVCSYFQEDHLANQQHLRALSMLGWLLAATVLLAVAMHWIRKLIIHRRYLGLIQ